MSPLAEPLKGSKGALVLASFSATSLLLNMPCSMYT